MPSAIFFGNDALAAGVLIECQRRGIRVPNQLAIVGFADLDIAAALEPALTSVRVPTRQMGEVAAQMLLQRLAKPAAVEALATTKSPSVRDPGFELMLRGTT